MKKVLSVLLTILLFHLNSHAQDDPKEKGLNAITMDAVKGQLEFLASDWMEGRATGEKGIYMAGDYIASMFKVYGIKPAGDIIEKQNNRREKTKSEENRSYFQTFNLIEYSPGENQCFSLISLVGNSENKLDFKYKTDFSVRSSDIGVEVNAPLVFVGYGFVDEKNNYNDLDDVDVEGKIIIRIPGFPGHKDTTSAAYKKFAPEDRYSRYRMNRNKNKFANKYGALAIIEINPDKDMSKNWISNYPFRYNTPYYEGDEKLSSVYDTRMSLPADTIGNTLSVVYVSNRVADELLRGSGLNLSEFEKHTLNKMKPDSKTIRGKNVYIKTSVNSRLVKARNVVGMIEGENPDEVIIVGGHYDHVGKRDGYIWNGTDDNASGTVGMMTVAKAFMATGVKPKKTIIFAAWTGEERGLFGSKFFVDNPSCPIDNIHFKLNLDMISRNSKNDSLGNKCTMYFSNEFAQLEEVTISNNEKFNLGIDLLFKGSKRPTGGSDHAPFARKDIPAAFLFTGIHEDYHKPADHISKVNWKKYHSLIKLSFLNMWDFSNMEGKLVQSENIE